MGTDPFSNVKTHLRPWDVDASMDTFLTRVDVAFEFFTKYPGAHFRLVRVLHPSLRRSMCCLCLVRLGVDYYCFHDVDVAPQGKDLKEFQANLDTISDKLLSKQKETGVKLSAAQRDSVTCNTCCRACTEAVVDPEPVFAPTLQGWGCNSTQL